MWGEGESIEQNNGLVDFNEEKETAEALTEPINEIQNLQKEVKEQIVTVENTYDTAKSDIVITENMSVEKDKKITSACIEISAGADERIMRKEIAKEQLKDKKKTLENIKNKFKDIKNQNEIQKIIDNLSDQNIKDKIIDKSTTNKDQEGNRYLIAARIAEWFIQSLNKLVQEKPEDEPVLLLYINWDNCNICKSGNTGDIESDRFFTMNVSLTVEKIEVDNLVSEDDKIIEENEFTIQDKIQKYTIVWLPNGRERYDDKDWEGSVWIMATPTPGKNFTLGLAKNTSPKHQIDASLNFGKSGDLTTNEIMVDDKIYTVTLDNGTLKFTEKPTEIPPVGTQPEWWFNEMNGSTETQKNQEAKKEENKNNNLPVGNNTAPNENIPKGNQSEWWSTDPFNNIDKSKEIQLKSTEEEKKIQLPLKNTAGKGEAIHNSADQIRAGNNVEQNIIDAQKNIIKMSGDINENKRIIEALIINPDIYSKEVEIVTGNYVLTITNITNTKDIAKIQINQQGKILTSQITMNEINYTVTLTDTGIKIEPVITKKNEVVIPVKITEESKKVSPIIIPPLEDIDEPKKEIKKESKDTNSSVEVQKENTEFTLENLQKNLPNIKKEKNEQGEELNYQIIFDRINSIENKEVKNEIEKRLLAGNIRWVQIYIKMNTGSIYDDNKADGIFDWRTLNRLTLFGIELKNNPKFPQDVKDAYNILHPDSGFAIVSKTDNNMYIFSPDRHLISIHPVILGEQMWNTPNEAYNNKNKTTPKGKYLVDKHVFKTDEFSTTGEYVGLVPLENQYNIDNPLKFTLGFHIRPKGADERETELENNTSKNRRLSDGCINTLSEWSIYDNLPTWSMFYVTDEP